VGLHAKIETDAQLRVALDLFETYPNNILIDSPVYLYIPNAHYDKGFITINEVSYKVSDNYRAFSRDENETCVLLGEATDSYGKKKTGCRNFTNNPINRDEMLKALSMYSKDKFHAKPPRKESVEG
jgi:hypothetical protein